MFPFLLEAAKPNRTHFIFLPISSRQIVGGGGVVSGDFINCCFGGGTKIMTSNDRGRERTAGIEWERKKTADADRK